MKTKKKKEKPIEVDAHFKYRCPKEDCGYFHWLSLNEVKTQNFKIVCDCGTIFSPKKIQKLKIVYYESELNESIKPKTVKVVEQKIDFDLIEKCVNVLVGYGFTDKESKDLLIKCHKEKPDLGSADLIKFTLQSFGG